MNVKCPTCGYEFISIEKFTICPQCFYQFSAGEKYPEPTGKQSAKPTYAAILLIIVAVLGLGSSGLISIAPTILEGAIPQTATIQGRVVDEEEKGIENATLTVINTALETKTNSTGWYKLEQVPIGFRKIKVEKPGNKTLITKAFIYSGETLDFKLTPGSGEEEEDRTLEVYAIIYSCAIIGIILSIFTLLGGISALKRKHFGLAAVGAVLGFISPFFIIGTILSVVALILLAMSKDEFKYKV